MPQEAESRGDSGHEGGVGGHTEDGVLTIPWRSQGPAHAVGSYIWRGTARERSRGKGKREERRGKGKREERRENAEMEDYEEKIQKGYYLSLNQSTAAR
ncbi:hypothetical protein EYF80_023594 [Liparis tanakae]|uniref:Uncharacterized protein n=1 Tax=Liparis tanakae TaxID=230148 RepID=A0A4Z2HK24_9TELE|nr:hypothetical protein EYF80_023594 [Liparis tanakae]